MPRPRNPEAGDNVSALQRGFKVLDCVAAAGKPLGNGDIARLTGIPQATVSRLTATLLVLGQLRVSATQERYELASGVVRLAEAFLSGIDVRTWARPHLAALAEATGASSFLAVRDGDDMLVVEAGRSRAAVMVMGADVGTRMAIATSALGRAWLAGVHPDTRAAVLERWRIRGGRRQPPGVAAMWQALAQAQERGYALSLGEWHPGIHAVAVPVRTAAGEVVAVNCGGPSIVLPEQRLRKEVLPRLLVTADALARDIGGVAGLALTQRATATAGADSARLAEVPDTAADTHPLRGGRHGRISPRRLTASGA